MIELAWFLIYVLGACFTAGVIGKCFQITIEDAAMWVIIWPFSLSGILIVLSFRMGREG